MNSFFYQIGSVTTTKPWPRPTYDRVRNFFLDKDIQPLAEKYNIHIVGGFLYNKPTWDIDLAFVYNYNDQTDWSLVEADINTINNIALNVYGLMLDICVVNKIHPLPTDLMRNQDDSHVIIKIGYYKKVIDDKIQFEYNLLETSKPTYGKIIKLGKYLVKTDRRGIEYSKKYTDMISRISNIDQAIESLSYFNFLSMSEQEYLDVKIDLNETI